MPECKRLNRSVHVAVTLRIQPYFERPVSTLTSEPKTDAQLLPNGHDLSEVDDLLGGRVLPLQTTDLGSRLKGRKTTDSGATWGSGFGVQVFVVAKTHMR